MIAKFLFVVLAIFAFVGCYPEKPASEHSAINLKTVESYAVFASSTITSTGKTEIAGNVGLVPGSSITGFPPGEISGKVHVNDSSSLQAKSDLISAYVEAATVSVNPVSVGGNIGGQVLAPGLYKSVSSLEISSDGVVLDAKGNTNAVWIFQIASTLTTAVESKVILSGGARAENIFWQVGSSATLGVESTFKGTIIANQSITLNTGVNLEGRALARNGAITLDNNIIETP